MKTLAGTELKTAIKRVVRKPAWRAYVRLFPYTYLIQRFVAAPYLKQPLAKWPVRVGRILDLSVPLSMGRLPEPSPACASNINNMIVLLERTRNVEGDVAECGTYRGAALVALALYATQRGIDKTFHGFDSFEGFAPAIAGDMEMGGAPLSCKVPGGMNETSEALVLSKARALRLQNIVLHKGFFEDTLAQCSERSFSFVHCDCDTYDSYKECLQFFYPRLSRGGILLLDEYNDPAWPGCNKAVDEFLRECPEELQVIQENNYQKYYFVKQ